MHRIRRLALVAATALAGGALSLPAAPAAARPADPGTSATLLLRVRAGDDVRLRARPGGRTVARTGMWTDLGSRTVFAVLARRGAWAQVSATGLRGRPAWVRMDRRVAARWTRWRLEADVSERRLSVVRDGRVVRTISVGVGAARSPTPLGRFQVTDKLDGARYGPAYGCCIVALSTEQSRPPPGWRGMARMAVHGTNAPASVGRAASAGCLHARGRAMRWLMRAVPLGTPVEIAR